MPYITRPKCGPGDQIRLSQSEPDVLLVRFRWKEAAIRISPGASGWAGGSPGAAGGDDYARNTVEIRDSR